jgi:hypothetical protein
MRTSDRTLKIVLVVVAIFIGLGAAAVISEYDPGRESREVLYSHP